jgi:hypothetical protein
MGVDCLIYDGTKHETLDRWWVFSDMFTHGHAVPRDEALRRLRELIQKGDKYVLYWANAAHSFIENSRAESFVFYNNGDDAYFNIHFGGSPES